MVIDAVRTPVGRASADKGYYPRRPRPRTLGARHAGRSSKRTGIDPRLIEDVRWGCVQQQGEQGFDVARIAALVAGLPIETGGVTINRNCASSLQAINDAAMSIAAGCEDVQIAGGVEHMDHVPMSKDYNPCPGLFRQPQRGDHEHGPDRRVPRRQVPHSPRSSRTHSPSAATSSPPQATDNGEFHSEIVPTWGRDERGRKELLNEDQCIRRDTSIESLGALSPAFNPEGARSRPATARRSNVGAAAHADHVGGEGPRAGSQADGEGSARWPSPASTPRRWASARSRRSTRS